MNNNQIAEMNAWGDFYIFHIDNGWVQLEDGDDSRIWVKAYRKYYKNAFVDGYDNKLHYGN